MTTWVGGVCAKKRANEARFNRWRSMMRHCALAIASWNTLFARSTAIVVAFILVSSWLLLMGSADAAHSAASEPGGVHTIVAKATGCYGVSHGLLGEGPAGVDVDGGSKQ